MIIPDDEMMRLIEEHDISNMIGRPVYVLDSAAWASVGRLLCVTPDHLVLDTVTRIHLDSRHGEFMGGRLPEGIEYDAWPESARMWIPIGCSTVGSWAGKLPLTKKLKEAE